MRYEETVAVAEKDRKKIYIRVVVSLVLSYLLMNIYTALVLPFAGIARLVFIGIAAVGIYFAFRHGFVNYIYIIEDSVLSFAVNNGKYDKVLYEIDAEYVRYIAHGKDEANGAKLLNMTKTTDATACCTCVFADKAGKMYALWFEPSEVYLEKVAAIGVEIR